MSTVAELPLVSSCTVAGCSYNHDGCHAGAVTIEQSGSCGTFIPLDVKGGLPVAAATVGACQRADCVHNENLECTAAGITVAAGSDQADCATFEAR